MHDMLKTREIRGLDLGTFFSNRLRFLGNELLTCSDVVFFLDSHTGAQRQGGLGGHVRNNLRFMMKRYLSFSR